MINTTNEGSKLYLYSITSVAILGGLLFGYDTAVISGAEKGLEAFFLSASDFQYNKVMHGITSSSALIGCVLGGAFSGIFASRLGRRNSLRLAAVLFFLSALGSYYPEFLFFEYGKPNMDLLVTFNLYRVLGGIGVGLASAVCPMYIAEIAPSNIRGTLVSCNQFAIIFGMLVVYFVNYLIMGDHQNPIILKDAAGVLSVSSESDMWTVFEGWRFMFGSEAFRLHSLVYYCSLSQKLLAIWYWYNKMKKLIQFWKRSMVRQKHKKFLMILKLLLTKKQKNSLLMEWQ